MAQGWGDQRYVPSSSGSCGAEFYSREECRDASAKKVAKLYETAQSRGEQFVLALLKKYESPWWGGKQIDVVAIFKTANIPADVLRKAGYSVNKLAEYYSIRELETANIPMTPDQLSYEQLQKELTPKS